MKQLANKTGISVPTISAFEGGKRRLIPANARIIETVLSEAGIVFINNYEGEGAMLRKAGK